MSFYKMTKDFKEEFKENERIGVLCAEPIGHLLDYRAPAGGCGVGDFLEVPLRKRGVLGVVWGKGCSDFGAEKLRRAHRVLDLAPMGEEMRHFLERAAAYNLAPLGAMLRLATRVQGVLEAPRMRKLYRLAITDLDELKAGGVKLTRARQRVCEALMDAGGAGLYADELTLRADVSASTLKGLCDKGVLRVHEVAHERPFARLNDDHQTTELSAEQRKAAATICADIGHSEYRGFLLKGVTGSGKTEVYIEAISACLRAGKMALVLMPEIGLTGAFLERIERRFGVRPAQWHSGVSNSERRRCWKMVAKGEAQLVVGARSALYLGFKNLGLIIVDEEHDGSYKQEEGVRYHARDMAVLRASMAKAKVVLVSATPSLESWNNVQNGKYTLVNLTKRYNAAALPDLQAIDMRKEKLTAGRWISERLRKAVERRLERGEQVLLFLNRRGYAPITMCRACAHYITCAQCDSRLVEHRFSKRLVCHQCGDSKPLMRTCPSCGAQETLVAIGPGIERLNEEAQALFPDARISVMSSDRFTSARAIRDEILAFGRGEADIIIGTQLIAKGHNFPHLTLVGVIDADLGLQGADLRAGERSFQIIHQVCGRAGRAEKAGVGLLQTYQPDHGVIKSILADDIEGFWQAETQARKAAKVPPFGRFVSIIISAHIPAFAEKFARQMADKIEPLERIDAEIYGPAPAPITRIRGKYRMRFLIKAPLNAPVQKAIQEWVSPFRPPSGVSFAIDIDPQSFY